MRFLPALLVSLAAVTLALPADAIVPRTETASYTGPRLVAVNPCSDGAVCFYLDGDETSVTITLADATSLPVTATYWAEDTSGTQGPLAVQVFCGSSTEPIPTGTWRIRVVLHSAPTSLCPLPLSATAGLVIADFL